jgi:beta-barrel assembly-enhancing protease
MKHYLAFTALLLMPAMLSAGMFNKKDESRAIDQLPKLYKASSLAIGAQKDIDNRLIVQDLAPIAELESYMNTKLLLIKKTAGMESVPGRVVVTASPLLNATTSADGNIYIGIGFIRNLTTEDEIIALLSHEFAHAAFNHNSSDTVAKAQQNLINAANLSTTISQKFSSLAPAIGGNSTDIQKYLQNADLALQLTNTVALPAWQREQEMQADFLAVDITQAMGYSYARGMKSFLELLNNEDEQERAKRQAKKKEFELNFAERLGKADNKSEVMDAAKNFGGSLQSMLEGLMAKAHYTADKRLEKCNEYYETYYGEDGKFKSKTSVHEKEWATIRNRASVKTSLDAYKITFDADNRLDVLDSTQGLTLIKTTGKSPISGHPFRAYVLARAYKLNGDYPRFEQTIAQSEKSGRISWRLVQMKADYELAKGNKENANQIYEQEFERRGRPPNAMPDMHEFYIKTGNSNKANQMQMSCQFGQGKNSKECSKDKAKGKN